MKKLEKETTHLAVGLALQNLGCDVGGRAALRAQARLIGPHLDGVAKVGQLDVAVVPLRLRHEQVLGLCVFVCGAWFTYRQKDR